MLDKEQFAQAMQSEFQEFGELPEPGPTKAELFTANPGDYPLDELTGNDLLVLKARVDQKLADKRLTKIDLEQEFLVQLGHARTLQRKLEEGNCGKPNELAAALTGVTNILREISKCRESVHSTEMLRKLEGAIIEVFREEPESVRKRFFERYNRAIQSIS